MFEFKRHGVRYVPIILSLIISLVFAAVLFCAPGAFTESEAYADAESVYLGGMPIGLDLQSSSPVAKDFVVIVTKDGTATPAKDAGIQKGDMLTELIV